MPPTPPNGDHEAPRPAAYPAGVPSTYPYPDVHAARLLDDAAQDFPDAVAVEYRRYRLSYRKLADHTDRLATALSGMGVGPGTRVALLLPNCPQLIIALFATWRVGAEVLLTTPERVASLANDAPSVVIVIDHWYAAHVAPLRSALGAQARVVVAGAGEYLPFPDNALVPVRRLVRGRPVRIPAAQGVAGFGDLVHRNPPEVESPPLAQRLPALSTPRGDVTQCQLVVNCFQVRLWLPDVVAGDERIFLGLPLSSTLGVVWIMTAVLAAATMIVVDDRRAAVRQRIAARARPTVLPFDERLADQLLRPSRRRPTLSSVRIALTRDPLPASRRRELEDLTDKGRVRRAWGPGGLLTHADPVYGRAVEGTVGLPLPDTAAVVADPTDARRWLPPGRRGRLWLRGPQLRAGGWNDAGVDATLAADGYLVVHDDGPDRGTPQARD